MRHELTILLIIICSHTSWASTTVNDITKLNPVTVQSVVVPQTTQEIIGALKTFRGPVSIGGGRYSMGGQTATENSLHLDMRAFKKILNLDVANKKITVQSGVRWRDIQEAIDKHELSVKIMQSYSNFTIGGSLSVNAHGRYIGEGPLIRSIESFKVVLADGREVLASSIENTDIFHAAIGGYGGIGVITEITLHLTKNERLLRQNLSLPVSAYRDYFLKNIRDNKAVVLHNGDLYPPDYSTVSLESWMRTDKPLTITDRLIPRDQDYWILPSAISSLSTIPFGAELRQKVLDPLVQKKEVVVWRNYEASYDVAQLEPKTPRVLFTYVLQEYFVPVSQLESFIAKMRNVLRAHKVNVVNVSIRHALPDPGSYLAWAPEEVFSLVLYYKQGTSESAKKSVGVWTRQLIDAALSVQGRYYLPYQIHATDEQFQKAYPNFQKFFAVKKKFDPTNKFRNKLWDAYYPVVGQ